MIKIDIIEDDDDVVVATVVSDGGTLTLLAEVEIAGRSLILRGMHIHGNDVGPNSLGTSGLRRLMREVMEELDVDEIRIEGARRTSGAGPGRTPRPLRFTRTVSVEERAEQNQRAQGGSGPR